MLFLSLLHLQHVQHEGEGEAEELLLPLQVEAEVELLQHLLHRQQNDAEPEAEQGLFQVAMCPHRACACFLLGHVGGLNSLSRL